MPRLLKLGLAMLVIGATPLLAVILAAKIGLWGDPDPNPIGLGLLFAAMTPPATILIAIGAFQWLKQRT
ncbi:MAG: hypothetical protein QM780_03770 [Hyphomicrobium sp.]|uniref:hypothetical protein n=1 Tax=Hyphomicrobium sp. TaxID=82 RepID=UPI0039E26C08